VATEAHNTPFLQIRKSNHEQRTLIRRQKRQLHDAAVREVRLKEAALLAARSGLPVGPARALLDLAARRKELDLGDALGLVSEVFVDEARP
jgi:hypothetical protein